MAKGTPQVKDDPEILDKMMTDTMNGSEMFRPTNYWANYEKKLMPELKELGLTDFRRRKKSILPTFGASDMSAEFDYINLFNNHLLFNDITKNIPLYTKFLKVGNNVINALFAPSKSKLSELHKKAYDFARETGIKYGAKPLESISFSNAGNPDDGFEINGNFYTRSMLYYYMTYAYSQQFIDFDKVNVMAELGSGLGKQTEVIKKFHPHITVLLFDIPPQLYVCNQYLSTVFPGMVTNYREASKMQSLDNLKQGNIYIFGSWQYPLLTGFSLDLFWNASSFQEMEPDVVTNYLSYINPIAKQVFLQEAMQGKEVAIRKGRHGVLRKTKLEDYAAALPNFKMMDMQPVYLPNGRLANYHNSFWSPK